MAAKLLQSKAIALFLISLFPSLAGCGVFFVQVAPPPGTPPPLGEPVAQPSGQLAADNLGAGFGDPRRSLTPAIGATAADLAGVWVLNDGYVAVYIDEMGKMYRLEIASNIDEVTIPPFVPRVFSNVGTVTIDNDGDIIGNFAVTIFGLAADGVMTGTLDESLNIIYDADTTIIYNIGGGQQSLENNSSWYRWDPESATFPALEKLI